MANILIVDDDPAVEITIRRRLERAGHHLTVAGEPLAVIDGCLEAEEPEDAYVRTGCR